MRRMMLLLTVMIVLATVAVAYAQDIDKAIGKFANDDRARSEGVKEIIQIGPPAIPRLQEVAIDGKRQIIERVTALILLGHTGNKAEKTDPFRKQAKDTLENMLKNGDTYLLRGSAALGLGFLLDKGTIPQLKEALNDKDGDVRMRSAWALAKLGDYSGKELALKTIKGEDAGNQILAVEVLEAVGDKSVENELRKNIDDPNATYWTKRSSQLAIKRLELVGLSNVERLRMLQTFLSNIEDNVREWAAKALGEEIINNTPNKEQALKILKEASKNPELLGNEDAFHILRMLEYFGIIKSAK